MKARTAITTLGIAAAFAAPAISLADITWQATNDEPGSRMVITPPAASKQARATAFGRALQPGDLSADRQYLFVGGDVGWQIRPMEYRFEGGRLMHVDDPVGHMHAKADTRASTAEERAARERSGGGN